MDNACLSPLEFNDALSILERMNHSLLVFFKRVVYNNRPNYKEYCTFIGHVISIIALVSYKQVKNN